MRRLGRLIWLMITVILIVVVIAFATSNEELLTLYLWPFDSALTAPIWLVVISSFIIGGLLSITLLWAQWIAIRSKLWRLQGKINRLKAKAIQQQAVAKIPCDKKLSELHTANYVTDHNEQAQEAKTAISESLRTDPTLR